MKQTSLEVPFHGQWVVLHRKQKGILNMDSIVDNGNVKDQRAVTGRVYRCLGGPSSGSTKRKSSSPLPCSLMASVPPTNHFSQAQWCTPPLTMVTSNIKTELWDCYCEGREGICVRVYMLCMLVFTCMNTSRTDDGITWLPLSLSIWSFGIGSLTEHGTQHFSARLTYQQTPAIFLFLCGLLPRTGVTGIYSQAMPSSSLSTNMVAHNHPQLKFQEIWYPLLTSTAPSTP